MTTLGCGTDDASRPGSGSEELAEPYKNVKWSHERGLVFTLVGSIKSSNLSSNETLSATNVREGSSSNGVTGSENSSSSSTATSLGKSEGCTDMSEEFSIFCAKLSLCQGALLGFLGTVSVL